ncbi:urease accessory UreF family protein, partial [Klebsiella michiganensis]|uniref:urease accessory UreF family protein n=1 Tax=Klebsiella michiganensis TaxID=1134687 RepID=UPI002B1CD5CB
RWTAYLLACRETRELRDEERNRGAAFTRLLADWQPDCPPEWRWLGNTVTVKRWLGHLPHKYHQRATCMFDKHGLLALLAGRFL